MTYWTELHPIEPSKNMEEWIKIQSTMCLMEHCIDQMKSGIAMRKTKKLSESIDKILSILSKQEYHIRNIKSE